MIPSQWRDGEVAVIGLGRTGVAVSKWLAGKGIAVYASDRADDAQQRTAARSLRMEGVASDVGTHDLERIRTARAVVVSPGVPPDAAPLRAARAAGVDILAELDLAMRALASSRSIVVTGTNGKTTTTALIAHLLRSTGIVAEAGGNIGVPLIQLVESRPPPEWIVVEASSFQLHDAPSLRPTIGVLTNLAPDHLNRYASLQEYYADKQLLFRNASDDSCWVLNADDRGVIDLAASAAGRRLWWSLVNATDAWFDRQAGAMMLGTDAVLLRSDFPLLGDHNVHNALAASLAASAAGLTPVQIGEGLRTFEPLRHRLEPVGMVEGVRWINDSKATNVASAQAALRAMHDSFVLIAGGRHKDERFDDLAPLLSPHCRVLIAYGEAGEKFRRELVGAVETVVVETLTDAVGEARRRAHPGDVVLLSPACTSFDQYSSYEERGDAFRHLVETLNGTV